jgi:predicted nucleic acid-binding protein
VILVDANLLLYARVSTFPDHSVAHEWLDGRLNGPSGVGLPWPSLPAFLRLSSNPKVFARPLPMHEAWAQVRDWLALPSTWCPGPTAEHEFARASAGARRVAEPLGTAGEQRMGSWAGRPRGGEPSIGRASAGNRPGWVLTRDKLKELQERRRRLRVPPGHARR